MLKVQNHYGRVHEHHLSNLYLEKLVSSLVLIREVMFLNVFCDKFLVHFLDPLNYIKAYTLYFVS